jgi:hypothetical protein
MHTPADVQRILQQSNPPRRPKDYDGRNDDSADSLLGKMLPWGSVNINVPLADPVVTREILKWMEFSLHHLIDQMDRESTKQAKLLRVRSTLHYWSRHVFKGWGT